ncbi:MAG: nucleotidyltransferase [Clostridia bacterium]
MKVLGIIAEYNPLHNGHIYHIQKSKKENNCDLAIVLMSGAFTQSGNISLIDKFKRAKIACQYGADLVIELPTIYSTSSAENFSFGAVKLLNNLNIIDVLSFGVEDDDISVLQSVATSIIENDSFIWDNIKEELKKGRSFATSRALTLAKILSPKNIDIIKKSNNILAIEYLKSLKKLNSNIIPYALKREGQCATSILNFSNTYISATSIRNVINTNSNIDSIIQYIPKDIVKYLSNTCNNDMLFNILKYKILTTDVFCLSKIKDVIEGLENKIINSISSSKNYDEFIHNIKSKRYELSKIKRMLNNIILNISVDDFNELSDDASKYAHVLAISKNGELLLSKIAKSSNVKLITSINDKLLNSLDDNIAKNIRLDILATNIQSSLMNEKLNKDYTNKL